MTRNLVFDLNVFRKNRRMVCLKYAFSPTRKPILFLYRLTFLCEEETVRKKESVFCLKTGVFVLFFENDTADFVPRDKFSACFLFVVVVVILVNLFFACSVNKYCLSRVVAVSERMGIYQFKHILTSHICECCRNWKRVAFLWFPCRFYSMD